MALRSKLIGSLRLLSIDNLRLIWRLLLGYTGSALVPAIVNP